MDDIDKNIDKQELLQRRCCGLGMVETMFMENNQPSRKHEH